jgi:hypothetical protein
MRLYPAIVRVNLNPSFGIPRSIGRANPPMVLDVGLGSPSIPNLTERDLYRFRATSAIFYAVEKAGGTIEKSSVSGEVTFLIDGHRVECSIIEKMVQSPDVADEYDVSRLAPHDPKTAL